MNIDKTLFSGKDVDDAVEKASQYYNVNFDLIDYDVIAKDQSLFSPLSGEVTIKVVGVGAKNKSRKKGLPKKMREVDEMLNKMLQLSVFDVETKVFDKSDAHEIKIHGSDEEYFVEKNGALLDAFQYLLNKMTFTHGKRANFVLECQDFRKGRIRQLKEMAYSAGKKVKDIGRPYIFSPMSPAERRQIHLALQEDNVLKTESLGDGFFKRVKVFLKNKK